MSQAERVKLHGLQVSALLHFLVISLGPLKPYDPSTRYCLVSLFDVLTSRFLFFSGAWVRAPLGGVYGIAAHSNPRHRALSLDHQLKHNST
jgi:hypothetical protein